jgi:N-acetylglucosaminyl-diphospho-decaprenol L-rhamnosyltransferase
MSAVEVSIVIVVHKARGHLERALTAVCPLGHEVIVVDNASTDGTAELVRTRFPAVRLLVFEENLGFARGNNAGIGATNGRYLLLMNADAWPKDGAVEELVAAAERSPRAAVIGPRLLNPDGSLQRSARGFPTMWRLATEYFFLRKLAPRSRLVNAFYSGGFDHDHACDVEWLKGAVLLVRREALDEVGAFDPAFFIFSDEVDLSYRFHAHGWTTRFHPAAEFFHVGGVSTAPQWSRFQRELLRGHLRFLAKHRTPTYAERARRMLIVALWFRGRLFGGERGRLYREAATWLGSRSALELLDEQPDVLEHASRPPLGQRKGSVRPRRDEEVLAVRRVKDGVDSLADERG